MALVTKESQKHTHSVVEQNGKQHSAHDEPESAAIYADKANRQAEALGLTTRYHVVEVQE